MLSNVSDTVIGATGVIGEIGWTGMFVHNAAPITQPLNR
jgi:hypothetical protein